MSVCFWRILRAPRLAPVHLRRTRMARLAGPRSESRPRYRPACAVALGAAGLGTRLARRNRIRTLSYGRGYARAVWPCCRRRPGRADNGTCLYVRPFLCLTSKRGRVMAGTALAISLTACRAPQFAEKQPRGWLATPVGPGKQSRQWPAWTCRSCSCPSWSRPHAQRTRTGSGWQSASPSCCRPGTTPEVAIPRGAGRGGTRPRISPLKVWGG
jgi:hypothetical protein